MRAPLLITSPCDSRSWKRQVGPCASIDLLLLWQRRQQQQKAGTTARPVSPAVPHLSTYSLGGSGENCGTGALGTSLSRPLGSFLRGARGRPISFPHLSLPVICLMVTPMHVDRKEHQKEKDGRPRCPLASPGRQVERDTTLSSQPSAAAQHAASLSHAPQAGGLASGCRQPRHCRPCSWVTSKKSCPLKGRNCI